MEEFRESSGIKNRLGELLSGHEKAANVFEHQMALAAELYERDHAGEVKVYDHATKERVMQYWANHGYGAVFREVLEHPDFKERFGGDALNVKIQDVEHFLRNRSLPER